jgi:hypothetical protein
MKKLITFLGWYGVSAIVLAYFLLSFSYLDSNNIWYQILNITGSVGLIIESAQEKDYPSSVLNIIWAAIALVSILKIIF